MRKIIILIVLCYCGTIAHAEATAPRSPEDVFSSTRVHTIHLRISADGWKMLQPGAATPRRSKRAPATTQAVDAEDVRLRPGAAWARYAYVRASIEFNGEHVADL